jgi:hypothetical protein
MVNAAALPATANSPCASDRTNPSSTTRTRTVYVPGATAGIGARAMNGVTTNRGEGRGRPETADHDFERLPALRRGWIGSDGDGELGVCGDGEEEEEHRKENTHGQITLGDCSVENQPTGGNAPRRLGQPALPAVPAVQSEPVQQVMSRRLTLVAVLLFACAAMARAGQALVHDRAVLVYPKERSLFRRIFYTSHQHALRTQIAARYQTSIHEQIATDEALFAIDVDGAKLLVISGHGDPFSIYFASRKTRTLDASDRERLARFFDRLDPEATIVLQSCHTGRGFAHLVKEVAGAHRRVIAARGEIPWNGLEITSVAPFDATIRCRDEGRRWDCTVRL